MSTLGKLFTRTINNGGFINTAVVRQRPPFWRHHVASRMWPQMSCTHHITELNFKCACLVSSREVSGQPNFSVTGAYNR